MSHHEACRRTAAAPGLLRGRFRLSSFLPGAALLLCAAVFQPVHAERIVLVPSKDATLIEDPAGALADGSGRHFRAGRTGQPAGSIRRGLIEFDVAGALPRDATITDAMLVLEMSASNAGPIDVALHRVLREWGEGASVSSGGGGVPAEPGDATWIYRFYDRRPWDTPGGDRREEPSVSALVDGRGTYTWRGDGLLDDLRLWHARPGRNHGWMLVGDETSGSTVKRFDSGEISLPALPPLLVIEYEPAARDEDSSSESSGSSGSSSD